jgi:hypothetical protein
MVIAKLVKAFARFSCECNQGFVTILLLLIIQPTAACEDERQFVRHGGQEWTTLKRLAADHHNRLEEEAPRLLGIDTEPEFATGQRALLLQSDGGNLSGMHHASRRPDRCRAQRARRYPRHRDPASALLHDDGKLCETIRCANIFAHCRSRVGDAQESAHPILGRNNAFVVGWSDTDQLRRTFRGRRGVALASRCKRKGALLTVDIIQVGQPRSAQIISTRNRTEDKIPHCVSNRHK